MGEEGANGVDIPGQNLAVDTFSTCNAGLLIFSHKRVYAVFQLKINGFQDFCDTRLVDADALDQDLVLRVSVPDNPCQGKLTGCEQKGCHQQHCCVCHHCASITSFANFE